MASNTNNMSEHQRKYPYKYDESGVYRGYPRPPGWVPDWMKQRSNPHNTLNQFDTLIAQWEQRLLKSKRPVTTQNALRTLHELREARQQFLDAHPNLAQTIENGNKEQSNGDN